MRNVLSVYVEQRGGLQYYDPQEQAWTPRVLEMAPTRSGISLSPSAALKCNALFACIRNVSKDVAKMPMHLYKHIDPQGKERQRNAIEALLNKQPNPEMSAFDFKQTLQAQKMSGGNGYAEIEFNKSGMPIALWPLPADRMTVKRRKGTGEVYYEFRAQYLDNPVPLEAWQVFHIKELGYDGLVGYSPVQLMAETIGINLAQERFAASFFGNGAYPGVILTHPARLDEVAEKRLKRSWEDGFRGSDGANRTAILMEGMKADKMTLAPDEAQFLESRQFSVEDICRGYRVPPHKVGHLQRSTFSNIEQQNTEYVTDCLMDHTEAWEQEADRKLLATPAFKDMFFEHKFTSLLRGDAVSRATFYSQMRNTGVMSTNDIRALENMNPVEDGDVLLVQGAMISLEAAANAPAPATAAAGMASKPGEKPPEKPENDPVAKEKKASKLAIIAENHAVLLTDVIARSLKIEAERVSRAAKKPNFEAWKTEFYTEHNAHLYPAVRNVIASLLTSLDCDPSRITRTADEAVKRHIAESQSVTVSTAESAVIGWNESRARWFAKEEVEKIVKEMTV